LFASADFLPHINFDLHRHINRLSQVLGVIVASRGYFGRY